MNRALHYSAFLEKGFRLLQQAGFRHLTIRSGLTGLLVLGLPLLPMNLLIGLTSAQTTDPMLDMGGVPRPKAVHGQVSISRDVLIAPGGEKVSLNLRDASLRDVLNILAQQGRFNLIMDPSVQGTLTVDIKNISINKALEYLFTVAQLGYTKDGNTLIVASREQADAKSLNAKTLKAIPVLYKDAGNIARILNDTIFKVSRPGGSTTALASSDPDSNSLLVMGTEADIKLVSDTLRELDAPRNRKVYPIRHNTPNYVANVLAANFFMPTFTGNNNSGGLNGNTSTGGTSGTNGNTGTGGTNAAVNGSGTGVNGGAGGTGSTGNVSNGTGMNGGGSTGTSTGASGGTSGTSNLPTLGTFTVGGVTFIAEPISSTLTVLGTDEQLRLIDSIINQVDVRRPQVEIEVSLVEIQNSELKNFKPLWGQFFLGKEVGLTLNQLDSNGSPTGVNVLSILKNNITGRQHSSAFSSLNLNQSHQSIKGKVLANPTIVAMDGQTSTITITDQIPNISQIATSNGIAAPVVTTSITTQDAGIALRLTPNISNDGAVVLNLNPDVSQPTRVVTAGTVSTTLISKRTLNLSGVRVRDGQTLVIGGLLQEGSRMDISRIPGLDKLPIVSAMFRTINSNNRDKTELVLMVTPHILREEAVTYFSHGAGNAAGSNRPSQQQDTNRISGFHPVSMPRFMEDASNSIPLRPSNPAATP